MKCTAKARMRVCTRIIKGTKQRVQFAFRSPAQTRRSYVLLCFPLIQYYLLTGLNTGQRRDLITHLKKGRLIPGKTESKLLVISISWLWLRGIKGQRFLWYLTVSHDFTLQTCLLQVSESININVGSSGGKTTTSRCNESECDGNLAFFFSFLPSFPFKYLIMILLGYILLFILFFIY